MHWESLLNLEGCTRRAHRVIEIFHMGDEPLDLTASLRAIDAVRRNVCSLLSREAILDLLNRSA